MVTAIMVKSYNSLQEVFYVTPHSNSDGFYCGHQCSWTLTPAKPKAKKSGVDGGAIRCQHISKINVPNFFAQIMFTVTSLIFPAGFPEASTKLELNKKYSDFQKLQKSLSDIHKNLYLKGNFPTLPKASTGYFNKSTETPGTKSKFPGTLHFITTS